MAELEFFTLRGKRCVARIVSTPGMDGALCDVDIDGGVQFRVSIGGRRLPAPRSDDAILAAARDGVLDVLVRDTYAPGVRHNLALG